MRLALQTDYALRTLLYLATNPGRGNVGKVASFYRISKDHVAKVVQALVRLGYVRSIRGVGGGIELRLPPEEIRLGQVIHDLEGSTNLLECVTTENLCVIQPSCRLKTVMAQAESVMMDYLQKVRLADVIPENRQLVAVEIGPAASRDAEPLDET